MNPLLKSDNATETDTDWGFIVNDELMADLKAMVGREAHHWDMDFHDTLQEVYLWLAVRPERTHEDENWKIVNGARGRVATLRKSLLLKRSHETPLLDDMADRADWDDES